MPANAPIGRSRTAICCMGIASLHPSYKDHPVGADSVRDTPECRPAGRIADESAPTNQNSTVVDNSNCRGSPTAT